MKRPRQNKTQASLYASGIIVLVPAVLVGLLVGIMMVGKHIESLRGGPGPHYMREDYMMMIIVAWLMVSCVLIPWSWLIAFRVWRRVARPIDGGCCIQCGYDLSGAVGRTRDCSECGRRNWQA